MQLSVLTDVIQGDREGDWDSSQKDPDRFMAARDGDHLMCPFLCEYCSFAEIQERRHSNVAEDKLLLMYLRRANIDALWARAPSTVRGNLNQSKQMVEMGSEFSIRPSKILLRKGEIPIGSRDWGQVIAVLMLRKSLEPGRNDTTVQFDTIRRFRSVAVNCVEASSNQDDEFPPPTNSKWFERFSKGCHGRMGDTWMPDRALRIEQLHSILELLEEEWTDPLTARRQLEVAMTGFTVVSGFGGGLRGEEIVLADFGSIKKHWIESTKDPRIPHLPLVLIGKFKTENTDKTFFFPLPFESNSGIQYRKWFERVLGLLQRCGVRSGPVLRVTDSDGQTRRATIKDLDVMFHYILRRVQAERPHVLSQDVNIESEFSVRRSLRRGSTTEAGNVFLPQDVIEVNNRWRKHMKTTGIKPSMTMAETYTDAQASLPQLIRYSKAL